MPRCPECREPVSPFAAGCALCGADLEAARRREAQRRRRTLPSLALPRWLSGSVVPAVVVVLVLLSFPLLGVLIVGLMLRATTLSVDEPLRLVLWVALGVGVALLVDPATRYGVAWLLLA